MNQLPYSKLSEVYDIGWGDFAESSQRFIATMLQRYGVEAGTILELACGTGILARHLARSGHVVLGIDRSPEMIAIATLKGAHLGGVEFRVGDMRNLDLDADFDAALCMFDSLNYLLTLEDVSCALKAVSETLCTEGIFIFDFNRPIVYSAHSGETVRMRIEAGILLQMLDYDASTKIARTEFRFPNGDEEMHIQRAYEMNEIKPLLEAASFSLLDCYSDFARRSVSSVSERLICVCQRN